MNDQYKIVMHLVNEGSSVHSQDKDCVRIIFVMSTLLIVYDIVDCIQTEYVVQTSSFRAWYFTADNDYRPILFCVKSLCYSIEYDAPLCH